MYTTVVRKYEPKLRRESRRESCSVTHQTCRVMQPNYTGTPCTRVYVPCCKDACGDLLRSGLRLYASKAMSPARFFSSSGGRKNLKLVVALSTSASCVNLSSVLETTNSAILKLITLPHLCIVCRRTKMPWQRQRKGVSGT